MEKIKENTISLTMPGRMIFSSIEGLLYSRRSVETRNRKETIILA
jgi:hypothetical protein